MESKLEKYKLPLSTMYPDDQWRLEDEKIFPLKLRTKLKDPRGKTIITPLVVQKAKSPKTQNNFWHTRIGIQHADGVIEFIGYLSYTLEINTLIICDIRNESNQAYQNVGTALHEYAFRMSWEHGKEGNIRLNATPAAVLFHIKNGFIPTKDSFFTSNNEDYEKLLKHYTTQLSEKKNGQRLTVEGCGMMHLPKETIQQKKETYLPPQTIFFKRASPDIHTPKNLEKLHLHADMQYPILIVGVTNR